MNEERWEKYKIWIWPVILFSGPLSLLFLVSWRVRSSGFMKGCIFAAFFIWLATKFLDNVYDSGDELQVVILIDLFSNFLFFNTGPDENKMISRLITWGLFGGVAGAVLGGYAAYKKYRLSKKYFVLPLVVAIFYVGMSSYLFMKGAVRETQARAAEHKKLIEAQMRYTADVSGGYVYRTPEVGRGTPHVARIMPDIPYDSLMNYIRDSPTQNGFTYISFERKKFFDFNRNTRNLPKGGWFNRNDLRKKSIDPGQYYRYVEKYCK